MTSHSCFNVQRAPIGDKRNTIVSHGSRFGGAPCGRRSVPIASAGPTRSDGQESVGILDSIFKSNPFEAIKEGTIKLRVGGGPEAKQGKNQSSFKGRDPKTVFVAGSSGRLGIRVVYELAAAGFKVRAGVRSQDKADSFDDELDALCERIGELDRRARSLINLVYCDLQDEESIVPAIGNASRVICAVGAAESEFTNLAAPKLIDYQATEVLINTAASCNVSQFILVTSLGTGKIGFPAGVLNLFGGILIWKRKAEEALEQSGMPYLIVRPGGMERPKDNHKEKYNVRLSTRDSLFGGTVSRLQVAELIAAAVTEPEVAMNKCIEVVAETEAPLEEYSALLDGMPVEVDQDAREAAIATYENLLLQERRVQETIEALTGELADTRDTIAGLQVALKDARDELKGTLKDNAQVLKDAEQVEVEVSALRDDLEKKKLLALAAKTVAQAQQKELTNGIILSSQEINSIKNSILFPPAAEESVPEEMDAVPQTKKKASQPFFAFGLKDTVMTDDNVQDKEEDSVVSETNKEKILDVDPKGGAGMLESLVGFLEGDARRTGPQPGSESTNVPVEQTVPSPAEQKVDNNSKENAFLGSLKNIFGGQEAVYIDDLEKEIEMEENEPQNIVAGETGNNEPQAAAATEEEEEKQINENTKADLSVVEEKKEKSMFPDIGSFIKPIGFSENTESTTTVSQDPAVTSKTSDMSSNALEAREWINAWRERSSKLQATGGADVSEPKAELAENVIQAREWISAWRKRTGA